MITHNNSKKLLLVLILILFTMPVMVDGITKDFIPRTDQFSTGSLQHGFNLDKIDGNILVGFKDNAFPSSDFSYSGWVTFDIEDLPEDACIETVELIGDCFIVSSNPSHLINAVQLIDRFPPLLSALALDSQIVLGTNYLTCSCMSTPGINSFYLGELARIDIKNAAQSTDVKWFAVGLKERFNRAFGAWFGKGEKGPILRVTYSLPIYEQPVIISSGYKPCLGEEYTISWTQVAGATGYTLYDENSGNAAAFINSGSTTSVIRQTYEIGSFPYTLKAKNDCGQGPASEIITVEVIDTPLVPIIITDPQDPFCVENPYTISWAAVNSAAGYEISADRGPWVTVPGKGGGTSYVVENPIIGDHSYNVRALNSCGASGRSEKLDITVSGIPSITAAPISDVLTPIVNEPYIISWAGIAGATNYELWENPSTTWSLIYSGPSSSMEVTNSETKMYHYFIKASNGCGTSSDSPSLVLDVVDVCCGIYTGGHTGNTDCDILGKRNLSDITTLIDHIFLTKVELCCAKNGDTNTDTKVNLADITRLIDHVFLSKAETATCQ